MPPVVEKADKATQDGIGKDGRTLDPTAKASIATSVSMFRRALEVLIKEISSSGYASNVSKLSQPAFGEAWKEKLDLDVELLHILDGSPMLLFCDCEGIGGIQELKKARQVGGIFNIMKDYNSGTTGWDYYDYGLDSSNESWWEDEQREGLNKLWPKFIGVCKDKLIHFARLLKNRAQGVSEAPKMLIAATLMQGAVSSAKKDASKGDVIHNVFKKRDTTPAMKEAR